jgi:hypothetical protein
MSKPPPRVNTREDGPMRGILGEEAGRRRAAVAKRAVKLGCDDCFAAQRTVLIGKRQSQDAETLGLLRDLDRGAALLVGPQVVTLDEAGHGGGRPAAQAEP